MSLPVCLSLCLSVCLCLFLSVYVSLCLCLSVCVCLSLPPPPSLSLSQSPTELTVWWRTRPLWFMFRLFRFVRWGTMASVRKCLAAAPLHLHHSGMVHVHVQPVFSHPDPDSPGNMKTCSFFSLSLSVSLFAFFLFLFSFVSWTKLDLTWCLPLFVTLSARVCSENVSSSLPWGSVLQPNE